MNGYWKSSVKTGNYRTVTHGKSDTVDMSRGSVAVWRKTLYRDAHQWYRSRGRQRRRWTEDIVDWTGLDINTAARLTDSSVK